MGDGKIVVVTDSSACIPESSLKGLDVSVIPLWLIWDNERFRDGVDIDPTTFYRRLSASKSLPSSSQPTSTEFVTFFHGVAGEADAIVNVLASSKISGTVASAEVARAQLPDLNIRIVDSLSSSMGMGLVVLAAARAAADGKSVDEVVAAAERVKSAVHFLFVVDTLEFLHKGGRISGMKRLAGTALSIKPILHFHDGQIKPLTQARTKHKAIARMMDIARDRLGGKEMAEAAVADVDRAEEGDAVADLVKARFGVPAVIRAPVSPVVGTHVGPGGIGFAFYAEE